LQQRLCNVQPARDRLMAESLTHRLIRLPEPVATLVETWLQEKRVGYLQLNFATGKIANVTVHTTIAIDGAKKA
jgi:hypothetical protein